MADRAALHHRDDCRLCGGKDLTKVLSLRPTPPANAFVTEPRHQPLYPLDLWLCRGCTHAQLLDVVDPAVLFEDYVYVSGTSKVFVQHFERYAQAVCERVDLRPDDLVVDIGSNDGTLLRFFADRGMRILGIDPARAIAQKATESGIETLPAFFTPALAERLRAERGPARVVTANNVFAHIDDLSSVVQGIRTLLAADGVFVFEVSYLLDVVQNTLFDTIYHEHLDYHTVRPLLGFFERHGMKLVAAERVSTHGGSLRGFVQLAAGPLSADASVTDCLQEEERERLHLETTFRELGARVDDVGARLRSLLDGLRAQGKRIAGFGAPAKATTLMHHFGLGRHVLEFIVDDSPLKQGLLTPGLHVPVLPSREMYERRPDYVVVLAWNFAESILASHRAFTTAGGRFIVPLPNLSISEP